MSKDAARSATPFPKRAFILPSTTPIDVEHQRGSGQTLLSDSNQGPSELQASFPSYLSLPKKTFLHLLAGIVKSRSNI
jgi:hypothetical protein